MIFLRTSRLKLRFIQEIDLFHIHAMNLYPEVNAFNTKPKPVNYDETAAIHKELIEEARQEEVKRYTFSILIKPEMEFSGLIALNLGADRYKRAEVWYRLHPRFWGFGYATEALKAVIAFGFNHLNLHRIEAGCAVENIASVRVLEKAGMVREGRKRQALPLPSGWSDNYEYAILASEHTF